MVASRYDERELSASSGRTSSMPQRGFGLVPALAVDGDSAVPAWLEAHS